MELIDDERRFELHELFFSTTDRRGVIQHGNATFQRISGYPLDQLLGAAHSIIRHPDMPRCVFRLLWDTIGAGKTIAAYVKNLAADGRYYWVMAVVSPCADGYLSIRLKPTSEILGIVRDLYGQLLLVERQQAVSRQKSRDQEIAAGVELLGQALGGLGFPDYDSFMVHAFTTEMLARYQGLQAHFESPQNYSDRVELANAILHCQSIEKDLSCAFQRTVQFRKINQQIMDESNQVAMIAGSIRTLSMNAKISAFHGNNSATLQEIAKALGSVSSEVQAITQTFLAQAKSTANALERLAFDIGIACLQVEVTRQFLGEIAEGDEVELNRDARQSLTIVVDEVQQRVDKLYTSLGEAAQNLSLLHTEVERMSRNNKRLSFVQFAGQKEAVVNDHAESFAVVFQEVRDHIGKSLTSCDSLFESVSTVREKTNQLLQRRDSIFRRLGELSRNVQVATSSRSSTLLLTY